MVFHDGDETTSDWDEDGVLVHPCMMQVQWQEAWRIPWFRGICHELVGFTKKTKGFYLVHIKFCTELCRICQSTYWMHPISFGKTGVLLVVASRPSFTCCLFFWVKSLSS